MKSKNISGLMVLCAFMLHACAPMTESPVPAAGKVFNGDYAGSSFTMAMDNSAGIVEEFIVAYNDLNMEKMASLMADTVVIYDHTGERVDMTPVMFEEIMSAMDSVRQDIYAIIPVKLENSDRVSVLVDSQEWRWASDGTEWRMRLWERYIVEQGKIAGVRQWSRDVGGS